jgi:hypothetical protein
MRDLIGLAQQAAFINTVEHGMLRVDAFDSADGLVECYSEDTGIEYEFVLESLQDAEFFRLERI